MNKYLMRLICAFIPNKNLRSKIRNNIRKKNCIVDLGESELVKKYLFGLNGIEIGGSSNNNYYLDKYGAYCNVNFSTNAWKDYNNSEKIVNIVANGDDLPFKDGVLDYVFTSHVMEHFFDPIKAIEEHLRVIKKNGYLFMIIPHKERTYDKDRKISEIQELIDRHSSKINITDYFYAIDGKGYRKETPPMIGDTHILLKNNNIPTEYTQFKKDDHHHWSVWTTESFLELCNILNLNVVEYLDVDKRYGDGFIIVIKKAN